MFEWIFLGLIFFGIFWWLYKKWRRKRLGIVQLKVDDFKAAVLGTGEALFSFRISRGELEKLLKTMAVSTSTPKINPIKKKRGRPKKIIKENLALKSKPDCFGELAAGLPDKPECSACIWRNECKQGRG